MVSADSQAAMDAAKKAVTEFMSKSGHNDTTVHERVAPAVVHETVSRTEKEELVTLVDREITQDHYHTSVQPITDSETLEEQHHHNLLPVETRLREHDDVEDRDSRLAAELSKFKNETVHVDGERTQNVVPMVAAEHIHHHVHEIIQPVVSRHTIEPHVIHTTVQIHEKVHNASKHHQLSALPVITMADFKTQGGVLVGREERWDSFEGEPRSVGGNVGTLHAATANGNSADHGNTQHAAAAVPQRRSSMAPEQRRASVDKTDKPLPTPSGTDTSKANEAPSQTQAASRTTQPTQSPPSQPQPTQSQPTQQAQPNQSQPAGQGQPNPGRFGFLPMNLARSAGSPVIGHQPVQTSLRTTPAPTDTRQGSVAPRPGEQKPAGQDQQQPRRSS